MMNNRKKEPAAETLRQKSEELGRLPENVIFILIKQKPPELSGPGGLYYICGSVVC